jgi:hypothetical protein
MRSLILFIYERVFTDKKYKINKHKVNNKDTECDHLYFSSMKGFLLTKNIK